MSEEHSKVLCVDDEPHVLQGLKRTLHRFFDLHIAVGPEQAQAVFKEQGPFPVVVSDLRMPMMDGLQLVQQFREWSPESVCVLLSGDADAGSAIQAINEGHVFRFLTKPCPGPVLIRSLKAAERQYRLLISEKILLEQTVRGCVKALCDVLAVASPAAFGRATRVKRWVSEACAQLGIAEAWHAEVAALLSQVGWVSVPQEVIHKSQSQLTLSADEQLMVSTVPETAKNVLAGIPRLESIVDILHNVGPFISGREPPEAFKLNSPGAKVLAAALELDALFSRGAEPNKALRELRSRGFHELEVLKALHNSLVSQGTAHVEADVKVSELLEGMELLEDLRTKEGALLVAAGQEATAQLIVRLLNAKAQLPPGMRIRCRVPRDFKN